MFRTSTPRQPSPSKRGATSSHSSSSSTPTPGPLARCYQPPQPVATAAVLVVAAHTPPLLHNCIYYIAQPPLQIPVFNPSPTAVVDIRFFESCRFLLKRSPRAFASSPAASQPPLPSSPQSSSSPSPQYYLLESKEVELQFTVCLQRFDFFLDGSKMPNLKRADWKPSHAIASWANWSRNEKTGKVVVTADAPFSCKEAAAVGCTAAAVCALRAEWRWQRIRR